PATIPPVRLLASYTQSSRAKFTAGLVNKSLSGNQYLGEDELGGNLAIMSATHSTTEPVG
ncbi:MAG: hypothetical protein M3358_18705, partial [Actinomycetota bacterium]|nr:hypothetical protein [Actinomycetota bacterium]